jgi:hypothetical protein
MISISLSPNRLGLRLDPGNRIEDHNAPIQNPQRPLNLRREVDVAWCINDIDRSLLPIAGCRRSGDSNAALSLLRHPIHSRGTIVYLTHPMHPSRIEKDAFGDRGFTGIDMSDDADISDLFQLETIVHNNTTVVPCTANNSNNPYLLPDSPSTTWVQTQGYHR